MAVQEEPKKESLLLSKQPSSVHRIKSSLNIEEVKKPSQVEFNFYLLYQDEPLAIKLPMQVLSVRDAIEQSIEATNQQHGLQLINDYQRYNLYAAKKNGRQKSDLPSLDYSQPLQKTKFQSFVVIPRQGAIIEQPPTAVNMEKVPNGKPPVQMSSPTKVPIAPQNERKSVGVDYSYYRSTAELMPKSQSKRQLPAEPTIGCLCFTRRANC